MKLPRFAPIAAILACALIVSACANTIRGVGRDVSNTANATQQAVEDVAE